MKRRGAFAVWYYGVIVRGPFATRKKAREAIIKIKKTCNSDYPSLRVAEYDKSADRQDPLGHWTHPSVLALCK